MPKQPWWTQPSPLNSHCIGLDITFYKMLCCKGCAKHAKTIIMNSAMSNKSHFIGLEDSFYKMLGYKGCVQTILMNSASIKQSHFIGAPWYTMTKMIQVFLNKYWQAMAKCTGLRAKGFFWPACDSAEADGQPALPKAPGRFDQGDCEGHDVLNCPECCSMSEAWWGQGVLGVQKGHMALRCCAMLRRSLWDSIYGFVYVWWCLWIFLMSIYEHIRYQFLLIKYTL